MKRRQFIKILPAAILATNYPSYAKAPIVKTKWKISGQQGLDACLLLGALSAPSLQAAAYPEESSRWRENLNPTAMESLARLRRMTDSQNSLLGPSLALLASAASSETLEATISAFTDSNLIKKNYEKSEFWGGAEEWQAIQALFPDILIVLKRLHEKGFAAYWDTVKKPLIQKKQDTLIKELSQIDLIAVQQRYVGRKLNQNIDIYLSAFSEPHGIRIIGQRFLTSYDYPSLIVKQNAAHEIFHPALLEGRHETKRIVTRLSSDPTLIKINARKDKTDGYSSIQGLIEEGMAQALEAVVSEQLGFGRGDMGAYWREQDKGIHVFAAAFYHAMHQDKFIKRGGDSLTWLDSQVVNNNLVGTNLLFHAKQIIGQSGMRKWL
jgi:hypothetical protein